jgi:hypothetical protein
VDQLGLPESEEPAVPDYVRPAGQPGPYKINKKLFSERASNANTDPF